MTDDEKKKRLARNTIASVQAMQEIYHDLERLCIKLGFGGQSYQRALGVIHGAAAGFMMDHGASHEQIAEAHEDFARKFRSGEIEANTYETLARAKGKVPS